MARGQKVSGKQKLVASNPDKVLYPTAVDSPNTIRRHCRSMLRHENDADMAGHGLRKCPLDSYTPSFDHTSILARLSAGYQGLRCLRASGLTGQQREGRNSIHSRSIDKRRPWRPATLGDQMSCSLARFFDFSAAIRRVDGISAASKRYE
jgi:hypothetical protein